MNAEDEIVMEKNLWRCDCDDCSSHTDPDRHRTLCGYYLWYYEKFAKQEEFLDIYKQDVDEVYPKIKGGDEHG